MTQQEKSTHPESAETTPTRFVNAGEVLFAYRRFGNPAGIPLVFLQHFRGSMDNWDPALLNCFAKDRLVITFDNAGVGFSSGEVPDTVAAMARLRLTSSTPSISRGSICSVSRWGAISRST